MREVHLCLTCYSPLWQHRIDSYVLHALHLKLRRLDAKCGFPGLWRPRQPLQEHGRWLHGLGSQERLPAIIQHLACHTFLPPLPAQSHTIFPGASTVLHAHWPRCYLERCGSRSTQGCLASVAVQLGEANLGNLNILQVSCISKGSWS